MPAQARTKLVAVMDADFLISSSLAADLRKPSTALTQTLAELSSQKTVMILPAFETDDRDDLQQVQVADGLATKSKAELRQAEQQGLIQQFDATLNFGGHECSNHSRWWGFSEPFVANMSASR